MMKDLVYLGRIYWDPTKDTIEMMVGDGQNLLLVRALLAAYSFSEEKSPSPVSDEGSDSHD